MSSTPSWESAGSLLCVRLDALGDVLMTTPAIHALREAHPRRRITLLTSPNGARIGPMLPDVDEVLVYEAPWTAASPPRASVPEWRMLHYLRTRKFDGAIMFNAHASSALPAAMMAFMSEIP